jgi:hypothetical protein
MADLFAEGFLVEGFFVEAGLVEDVALVLAISSLTEWVSIKIIRQQNR